MSLVIDTARTPGVTYLRNATQLVVLCPHCYLLVPEKGNVHQTNVGRELLCPHCHAPLITTGHAA